MSTLASREPRHAVRAEQSILTNIVIEHGPIDVLGRFFVRADTAARECGAHLTFASCDELVQANRENRANWLPLVPLFDPANGNITAENSFCILGKTQAGAVVAAHAARLYTWPETTFVEEIQSLRLFYSEPERQKNPGEHVAISALGARVSTGRVCYSGPAWVHPEDRGRGLSKILRRFAKAYALAKWNPAYVASLMTESVFKSGFAPRFSYNHVDWEVRWVKSPLGTLRLAV